MGRGRLIFPFLIDIAQLDTAATAADPDGAGPATSGYDPDFREPIVVPPVDDSSEPGDAHRVETIVQLLAQVESDQQNEIVMLLGGRASNSSRTLIFLFEDLEAAGMIEAGTGQPKLRAPGDRLAAIRNRHTGELIEEIPREPGWFATEVRSIGFGPWATRDLLLVRFEERASGVERP